MNFSSTEAGQLALNFLVEDLNIASDDRDFFTVLSARQTGSEWYVVEIGIEGLPDKWAVQVFDTRECDPCYTFISPVAASEVDADLIEFPAEIAEVVATERRGSQA